jgi:hypothetical protein
MQTTIIIVIALAALGAFIAYAASLLSATVEPELQECLGCGKDVDIETMLCDDDCNWYCRPCYDELSPVWQAEYAEMLARGEIDPDSD